MVFSCCLPFMSSHVEKRTLPDIAPAVEARVGRIPFSGRYHREPRKIEDDYVMLPDVLGHGTHGNVTLATSKATPEQRCAVKSFHVNKDPMGLFKAEVQNYLCLDHPHITRLHAVYETEQHVHLVMECMEGGELLDRLTRKRRFSENDACDALRQMLLALNYMHSHGIVHRDIKLENFMYVREDGNHLKLIDFGLSALWSPNSVNMNERLGTPCYRAPEVFSKSYTSQCDMWSLGVVGFTLLCGVMPFDGGRDKICAGKFAMQPHLWGGVSSEAKIFIRSLLNVNPERRLCAQQALEHSWIASAIPLPQSDLAPIVHSLHDFSRFSTFRRRCMKVIALSLQHEDHAKLYDSFLSLDSNRVGTVTLTALRSIMAEKLHITDESEIQRIFGALDYSQDQEIHYSDFLAAMAGNMIDIEAGSVRTAFQAFDKDGSGFISAYNLLDVFGSSEEKHVYAYIKEADSQNNGHICFTDFLNYVKTPSHDVAACDGQIDDLTCKAQKRTSDSTCIETSSACFLFSLV